MFRSARMSEDGRYRYDLTRSWANPSSDPGDFARTAAFIMLNPSTADGTEDDPTVRRCIGFARDHGCSALRVANLFAWRATDPDMLLAAHLDGEDIVGPENGSAIDEVVSVARITRGIVICAWGAGPAPLRGLMAERARLLPEAALHCLGTTKSGQPRHPLYLPASATAVRWADPNASS
mgnify:FL=1